MDSLRNIPWTLRPVNVSTKDPGTTIPFDLAEHQQVLLFLSRIIRVGSGLFSYQMQTPDIWNLVERRFDHVPVCHLPDYICAYNSSIPHFILHTK